MLRQHFRHIFLTLTVYNIPSSSVVSSKPGQYSRSVLTGSRHIIFSLFHGNSLNILFTSFMRGNSTKFWPCQHVQKHQRLCMYRMPSPRPKKLVCVIHSQTQSRINTFFLLFFPLSCSSDALKAHILALKEVKPLFRQLWNSPFQDLLVDQFLDLCRWPWWECFKGPTLHMRKTTGKKAKKQSYFLPLQKVANKVIKDSKQPPHSCITSPAIHATKQLAFSVSIKLA